MADDHHDDDPVGAATRTFLTTMFGAVLFMAAMFFILI